MNRKRESQLTGREQRGGWIFFLLYLFIFPLLVAVVRVLLETFFSINPSDTIANLVYHLLLIFACLLYFHRFLATNIKQLFDFLPENLFALLTGFMLYFVLWFLASKIPLPLTDPTGGDYAYQFRLSPVLTILIYVILMPITEQLFFQGVMFGSLRSYARPLAYLLTVPLFALYSVWHYGLLALDIRFLYNAITYLPAGLALSYAYDRGGSIASPIVLKYIIHALTLFLALR